MKSTESVRAAGNSRFGRQRSVLWSALPAALVVALLAPAAWATPAYDPQTYTEPITSPGGGAWIGAMGGLRLVVPQLSLTKSLESYGLTLANHVLPQPAASAEFFYHLPSDWAAGIDIGYSTDKYVFTNHAFIDVGTLAAQIVVEWIAPIESSQFVVYVKGALGYYFSSLSGTGTTQTLASNAGGYLAVGARMALVPKFGLSLEERYAFAFETLQQLGFASVGGNTVALGLYYVY